MAPYKSEVKESGHTLFKHNRNLKEEETNWSNQRGMNQRNCGFYHFLYWWEDGKWWWLEKLTEKASVRNEIDQKHTIPRRGDVEGFREGISKTSLFAYLGEGEGSKLPQILFTWFSRSLLLSSLISNFTIWYR